MASTAEMTQDHPAASAADLEHVVCPLCGEDRPRDAMAVEELFYDTRERFTIVRCGGCGHLYLNPRPTAESLARYYPDDYYATISDVSTPPLSGKEDNADPPEPIRDGGPLRGRLFAWARRQAMGYPLVEGERRTSLGRALAWPIAWHLMHSRRHVDVLPWSGEGRLLDFGCGDSRFLRLQRQRGWRVWAMDFNRGVIDRIRQRDGIEGEAGTWPGPAYQSRTFDAITSWHVIEHLPEPGGFLRSAFDRLAPGGYLLTCCPDADSWAFRFFREAWRGVDPPRHFSLFTRGQLMALLRREGFVVERYRPQPRRTTLMLSARNRAELTGSALWARLARRKALWSLVLRLTVWTAAVDNMIVIARRPAD